MDSPTPGLDERQRAALVAVCDAFHPSLAADIGDDPALFAANARANNVAELAEQAIGLLAPDDRAEVGRLLTMLGGAPLSAIAIRSLTPFTQLSRDAAERMLGAMRDSRAPRLRTAFQLLKRLSSFLFYAGNAPGRDNATWQAIGYRPSSQPIAVGNALVLTSVDEPTTLECDACVIGSGAGGGVVAAALAARGLSVIVLEAGPGDQSTDFAQRELEGNQRLYLDHGLTATRDLAVSILAGACLGGGTTVNWQTSLRTPDFIREEWDGLAETSLFCSSRFGEALNAVSARMHVSTDESIVNANNDVIRRGCSALDHEGDDPSQLTRLRRHAMRILRLRLSHWREAVDGENVSSGRAGS